MAKLFTIIAIIGAVLLDFGCTRKKNGSAPDPARKKRFEAIKSLPYASSTPIAKTDLQKRGVVFAQQKDITPGINLFASRDSVYLVDNRGAPRLRWRNRELTTHIHHAELGPDGSIFALSLSQPQRLIKIAAPGKVVWHAELAVHHDIDFFEGKIFVLTNEIVEETIPKIGVLPMMVDRIHVLDSNGKTIADYSLFDVFREFLSDRHLKRLARRIKKSGRPKSLENTEFDVLHANALTIIRKDIPGIAKRGQVLVCLRQLNLVAIFDLKTSKVVWSWGPKILQLPHQPVLSDDRAVYVFDNSTFRGWSRILKVGFDSKKIVWRYEAAEKRSFFTPWGGGLQPLPDGHFLLTQTIKGRAFEIDEKGAVVWDFWNPDIDKKNKRATIYRVSRHPESSFSGWL